VVPLLLATSYIKTEEIRDIPSIIPMVFLFIKIPYIFLKIVLNNYLCTCMWQPTVILKVTPMAVTGNRGDSTHA